MVYRHKRTEIVDHDTLHRCPLSLSCTLDPLLLSTLLYPLHSPLLPSTLLYSPPLSSTPLHSPLLPSSLFYSPPLSSTPLHSPLLPSTLLYSPPLSSTLLHSPLPSPLSSTPSTLLSSPVMYDYLPAKVRTQVVRDARFSEASLLHNTGLAL